MSAPDWLADTRTSYDTVAESYTDLTRESLAKLPLLRGVLALFAEAAREVGGPVADVGCGPGHITAHLRGLGLDAFGVDLSPRMVDIARRDHPGARFEVGSMTDLPLADGSVGAVLAFYSVIHVPDAEVPAVLAHFRRVLRPGGVVLLGFHVGDRDHLKTEGYGGHPMSLHVHRRPVERVAGWLRDAGFTIAAQVLLDPDDEVPGGVLVARTPA
ncbi:methyltransferase family protein [Saccharothrix saharensis]|uniref:Methyltransferase family protein n=1 Tax=Saccharothrix saharensis TaxID=571190 RepID=A0A543JPU9_9PSEU|nr:class I SAM-dependent methyltransferase [Saccharothrix saharensis]TQM84887.1 methyltransferase family protein [Saccharothrix saharensis]